ncbi:MAG TPA: efflux RND transporter periplasmic adaptor subunit [Nevskiaceae bacterium]|nr:efflux RND transporter periplasmic adaptor subunit [Nevskiaceae bacterium]
MRKTTILIVVILLIVVFGGIFGGKYYAHHEAAEAAAHHRFPPTTVTTAVAKTAAWSPIVKVVGSLEAVSGTEITAQIAGNVTHIAFTSGAHVRKGQLLVRLNDSNQRAALHSDQAKLQLARATLARAQKLYAAHATSQLELQTAQANAGTASAAVENDRATLAKLNILAPFSGVLGIRAVSLGQYVSPGTAIVSLQSYHPLYLNFSLPQSQLSHIAVGRGVGFTVSSYPGHTFTGKVTSIGSRIDPTTRNIDVQATLDNHAGKLRPGMFGNVTLNAGAELHGVAVPDTAITYSTFGDSVFVVMGVGSKHMSVHQQIVQVADERSAQALLASGVKAGDTVVTVGQNKLRSGMPVVINNSVQP